MSYFDDLWKSLDVPLARDGANDFRTSVGEESVENAIVELVAIRKKSATRPGELRWNQKVGTLLDDLRHKNYHDSIMTDLARHEIIDVIDRYEPRARITSATVSFEKSGSGLGRTIKPSIGYMIVSQANSRTESKVSFGF
jgi:hypothetical protein